MLKSYRPTAEYPERDMTSVKKLREEMLAKEEELNSLSQQLTKQQEECRLIHEQLEKEKAKRQQFQETSEELVSYLVGTGDNFVHRKIIFKVRKTN